MPASHRVESLISLLSAPSLPPPAIRGTVDHHRKTFVGTVFVYSRGSKHVCGYHVSTICLQNNKQKISVARGRWTLSEEVNPTHLQIVEMDLISSSLLHSFNLPWLIVGGSVLGIRG